MEPSFGSSKVPTALPATSAAQTTDEIAFEPAVDHRPLAALLAASLVLLVIGLIVRPVPPVLLFGAIAAAVTAIGAAYLLQRRRAFNDRTQGMAAAAARFAMDYARTDCAALLPWLRETWLMSECGRVCVWNLIRGVLGGVPIAVADVVGFGRSESDRGFEGTVVMLPALGDLPNFVIRPADRATGVRRRFSRRQVVLDKVRQGVEFSQKYELWGDDAESPRLALSEDGVAFFAARPGWLVERCDGQLLIAKVPPRKPLVPLGAKSFRLSGSAGPVPDSAWVKTESLPALIKHAVAIRELTR